MAVATIAARAATLAGQYGPRAVAAANVALSRATGGRVKDVSQITTYATNPRTLSVASQALASAGVPVNEIFTDDLIGQDRALAEIRAGAKRVLDKSRERFEAGADRSLEQSPDNVAADVLRKKRVRAVLSIYGNAGTYFLANPNGGIPASDFVWYDKVILDRP